MANVRLTPAIKHLLTLRSPNALPSPPVSQLNRIFTDTFRDAKAKKAETGWLVAAVQGSRSPYVLYAKLGNPFTLDLFAFDS